MMSAMDRSGWSTALSPAAPCRGLLHHSGPCVITRFSRATTSVRSKRTHMPGALTSQFVGNASNQRHGGGAGNRGIAELLECLHVDRDFVRFVKLLLAGQGLDINDVVVETEA